MINSKLHSKAGRRFTTGHILTALFLLLCTIVNNPVNAQKSVYAFKIHEEIAPAATRLTAQAIAAAEKQKASFLLLDLDTYGGLVDDADKIRTMLLQTKIPTLVFIKNNAASAGALISIACDSIYMHPGSTIGAACVVNQEGELLPEKYQSYMRSKIAATAIETGRDPKIAEGMVDENLEIDSVKAAGKIITLTTDDAIKKGYCNAAIQNETELLKRLGSGYVLSWHQPSIIDQIIFLLLIPMVSGMLLLGIFGGMYFEFKAPGTLFPIAISIICAALFFAPKYVDGLAANWEIVIFLIGLILLMLEIFVIPGFGITGISGIVLIVVGLSLAMVRNIDLDFSNVPSSAFGNSILLVSICMFAPLALLLAFGQNIFHSPLLKKMSVHSEMKSTKGFSVKQENLNALIGRNATCITDLRPQGKIEIDTEIFEANSEGTFFEKGSEVKVTGSRGNYLVVKKSDQA
ncbi:MAG: NfeD family protein [Chitinophagales bacterium]